MTSAAPLGHSPQQQVPEASHPMEEILNGRGVRPRTQWLRSCLRELAIAQPGFSELPVGRQAELCFAQFMMADFNVASAASLPPAMHSLHGTELPGPFVLQVDEIIDISHSLRERYQEKKAGPGRTLKLSLTDGIQRVSGLEYRPIRALQVFSPAGMKISLRNVCVKRGILMLVPEIVEVLGGSVEHLESARLRAVQVINKPPRGRRNYGGRLKAGWVLSRTRQGSVEPSLAEVATRAAWSASPEGSVASAGTNPRPQQSTDQAVSNNGPGTRPSNGVSGSSVHNSAREEVQQGRDDRNMQSRPSSDVAQFQQSTRSTSVHQGGQHQPLQQDRVLHPGEQSFGVSRFESIGLESREPAGVHRRFVEHHQAVHVNNNLNTSGIHTSTVGHVHRVDQRTATVVQQGSGAEIRAEAMTNTLQERTSSQVSSERNRPLQRTPTSGRLSLQSRRVVQTKLSTGPQLQAPSTVGTNVTTPIDLDDSQEIPQSTPAESTMPPSGGDAWHNPIFFTYLSVLKDKANFQRDQLGVVRGKVKCVITGVITFQYRDVEEFKLHIHIEDGSLLTAASVQHQLVQRLVGHSPQEIISGLKDRQTHRDMLDNMIRFQKFLERYEGTMEVEFSDPSSLPIVLQMTEGVELVDVGQLLNRLYPPRRVHTPNTNRLVPTINLSTP